MNDAMLLNILVGLMIACLPVGLIVYFRVFRHLQEKGGRVKTDAIAFPDLLVTGFLASFFGLLVITSVIRGRADDPPRITSDHIVPNLLFFMAMLLLLIGFLVMRRIEVRRFFGLQLLSPIRAVVLGVGLMLATYPLLLLLSHLVQQAFGPNAEQQDVVNLFRETVVKRDWPAVAMLSFAAAISQPLIEEVFFRGYFYPVAKRYMGSVVSALIVSALFAAVHLNVASLAPLFLLALSFTVAYEVTGSILVPITMHAFFNSSQLAALIWQAQSVPPP